MSKDSKGVLDDDHETTRPHDPAKAACEALPIGWRHMVQHVHRERCVETRVLKGRISAVVRLVSAEGIGILRLLHHIGRNVDAMQLADRGAR